MGGSGDVGPVGGLEVRETLWGVRDLCRGILLVDLVVGVIDDRFVVGFEDIDFVKDDLLGGLGQRSGLVEWRGRAQMPMRTRPGL